MDETVNNKKILIIGSGGMLGHLVTVYLAERGFHVLDISRTRKCRRETILMDVLKIDEMKDFLEGHSLDVIVNCAALLPKASEQNKMGAVLLNAYFPHWLEEYYRGSETRIIQVSTGGVYGGDHAPYSEDSCHGPVSFYGKTKSVGEIVNDKDLTIRSDFIGPDADKNGIGLFNWAMHCQETVQGYSRVFINGVTSLEFARFVETAIGGGYAGTYNLHADETISKADFIRLVNQCFGKTNSVRNVDSFVSDTSLRSGRRDIFYQGKSYRQMLSEIKVWMEEHRALYTHYF